MYPPPTHIAYVPEERAPFKEATPGTAVHRQCLWAVLMALAAEIATAYRDGLKVRRVFCLLLALSDARCHSAIESARVTWSINARGA